MEGTSHKLIEERSMICKSIERKRSHQENKAGERGAVSKEDKFSLKIVKLADEAMVLRNLSECFVKERFDKRGRAVWNTKNDDTVRSKGGMSPEAVRRREGEVGGIHSTSKHSSWKSHHR